MSICKAQLRNTSNPLTFRMSVKLIRLQVPPKLFRVNSWIVQAGSELQTVGLATENVQVPKVLRQTCITDI